MTNFGETARLALLASASVTTVWPVGAAWAAEPVGQSTAASAEPVASDAEIGEIIVTARKRSETLISVPVVVSAVGSAELQRRAVTNLDGIARIVPQLIIAPQGGSVQGGNISIRGISGPDSNPFGDQAVSFTIDGVQVAKSTVRRMSDTDLSQIEVLKGPQALFYGKNSMAGIVNIHTGDPTARFEAKGSVGYEFNAREIRSEGYVSGPVADGVGLRLAGLYSTMDGYLKDQTPTNSPYFNDSRNPDNQSFALRGTLKIATNNVFDARLKVNYGETRQNGPAAVTAFVNCPLGVRQTGAPSECTAGGSNINAGYGSFLSTIPGTLNQFRSDGKNFLVQKQMLDGLELNYQLSDKITITSVTGYYRVVLDQCQNYENDYNILLPSCNTLKDDEISEDLHLVTSFDGPFNLTMGIYGAKTKATTGSLTYLFGGGFDLLFPGYGGAVTPAQVNNYTLTQKGSAYSAFLELSYKPIDVIEINVGGRYSYEKKRLTDVRGGGGISEVFNPAIFKTVLDDTTRLTVANGALAKDHDSWDDFSPEATISYRPSHDLTVFGSYKHGFLSGGFNSSSVNFSVPNLDLSYRPQTIKGFEAGVKARVADNRLLLNLAAYTYTISDLQVTNFTNATSTIRNAAASKVKGIEGDFDYRTPFDGLSIHGAAAYNDGKYTSFPGAPCYNGQTPAMGCNLVGGNPVQNLAGTSLPRAPKWNASTGFNFETPVGDAFKVAISGDLNYTSSFLTDATSAPNGREPAYTLIDASARFGAADERWELALIGRNLTNKYYFVAATDVPFTGAGTGTAAGVLGDRFASLSRGREIMVRVSYKFGG